MSRLAVVIGSRMAGVAMSGTRVTAEHRNAVPLDADEMRQSRSGAFLIRKRDVVLVTLAAGLGYGFDAYAVNLFGMLGPTIMADLHLTVRLYGLIGSVFLVGYTLGTIGFGMLADRRPLVPRRQVTDRQAAPASTVCAATEALSGCGAGVAARVLRLKTPARRPQDTPSDAAGSPPPRAIHARSAPAEMAHSFHTWRRRARTQTARLPHTAGRPHRVRSRSCSEKPDARAVRGPASCALDRSSSSLAGIT